MSSRKKTWQQNLLRGQRKSNDSNKAKWTVTYFRDEQTIFFFDRETLIRIDLAAKTHTKIYEVTEIEKHSGYRYYFNPINNTVTIFSEYCAGCDIGGEIFTVNVDNLEIINKLSTRDYGQSFSFCKYYDDKFITGSKMFGTFTINYVFDDK